MLYLAGLIQKRHVPFSNEVKMKNRLTFLGIALCVMLLSSVSWAGKFINNLQLRIGGSSVYKKFPSAYTVVNKGNGNEPADLQENAGIDAYVYMGYTKTDSVKKISNDTFSLPITNIIVRDVGSSTTPASSFDTLGARYTKMVIANENSNVQDVDISNNKHKDHHLHIYYTRDRIDGKALTAIIVSASKSVSGYELVSSINLNAWSTRSSPPEVYLHVQRSVVPTVSFTTAPVLYNATNPASEKYLTYTGWAQNLLKVGTYNSGEVLRGRHCLVGNSANCVGAPSASDAGTYRVYYDLESSTRLKADFHSDTFEVEIHKMPANSLNYHYTLTVKNQLGSTTGFYGGDAIGATMDDNCAIGLNNSTFYLNNGKSFGEGTVIKLEAGSYVIDRVSISETSNCMARTISMNHPIIVSKSKIVFDSDEGSAVDTIEGKVGDPVTAPVNPTKDGYVFVKWNPSVPTKISRGTTTLKAVWNKLYTITFDTDGGSNIASISGIEGSVVATPKNPTRNEYTFLGWDVEIPATMPANDMTIKALWQYNRVKVILPEQMEVISGDIAEDGTYAKASTIDIRAKAGYAVRGALTYNGEVIEPKEGVYTLKVAENEATVEAEFVEDYGAIQITLDHSLAIIDGNSKVATNVPQAIEVNSVEMTRNFKRHSSTTITLPFTVDAAYVAGGIFCKFAGLSNSGSGAVVKLMFVSTVLQANVPYVYVPLREKLSIDLPAGETVSIKTEESYVEFGNWQFRSAYSLRKWVEGDGEQGRVYGFIPSNQESDGVSGKFQKLKSGSTLSPMRAYLIYNEAVMAGRPVMKGEAYVPALRSNISDLPDEIGVEIVNESDQPMAIGKFNTVTGEMKMDRWFDLNGKLLKGKPFTKGIYFHNGNKVLVK